MIKLYNLIFESIYDIDKKHDIINHSNSLEKLKKIDFLTNKIIKAIKISNPEVIEL